MHDGRRPSTHTSVPETLRCCPCKPCFLHHVGTGQLCHSLCIQPGSVTSGFISSIVSFQSMRCSLWPSAETMNAHGLHQLVSALPVKTFGSMSVRMYEIAAGEQGAGNSLLDSRVAQQRPVRFLTSHDRRVQRDPARLFNISATQRDDRLDWQAKVDW